MHMLKCASMNVWKGKLGEVSFTKISGGKGSACKEYRWVQVCGAHIEHQSRAEQFYVGNTLQLCPVDTSPTSQIKSTEAHID